MSWSAHKDPEQVKEHFDSDDVVLEKVKLLAKWVKNSKHFTAFTGAGISTSAGKHSWIWSLSKI
jgi:NAD-dependent histone deacetylase SIR2